MLAHTQIQRNQKEKQKKVTKKNHLAESFSFFQMTWLERTYMFYSKPYFWADKHDDERKNWREKQTKVKFKEKIINNTVQRQKKKNKIQNAKEKKIELAES